MSPGRALLAGLAVYLLPLACGQRLPEDNDMMRPFTVTA